MTNENEPRSEKTKIFEKGLKHHNSEEYNKASNYYRQAIIINPEHAAAHHSLGLVLHEQNKYDEAEEHYQQAIDIDPEYAEAYYHLGVLLGTKVDTVRPKITIGGLSIVTLNMLRLTIASEGR